MTAGYDDKAYTIGGDVQDFAVIKEDVDDVSMTVGGVQDFAAITAYAF